MKDEKTVAGWVVQVTIPGTAQSLLWRGPVVAGPSSFQFFNVAIGSAEAAIEAVRQKIGASQDTSVTVVRLLSVAELAAAGLRSGQIKPA